MDVQNINGSYMYSGPFGCIKIPQFVSQALNQLNLSFLLRLFSPAVLKTCKQIQIQLSNTLKNHFSAKFQVKFIKLQFYCKTCVVSSQYKWNILNLCQKFLKNVTTWDKIIRMSQFFHIELDIPVLQTGEN